MKPSERITNNNEPELQGIAGQSFLLFLLLPTTITIKAMEWKQLYLVYSSESD